MMCISTTALAICRLFVGPVMKNQQAALRASPVHFVTRRSAPFLFIHGDQDSVVPLAQIRMLHEALLKAGVESELLTDAVALRCGPEFQPTEKMGPAVAFFDRHFRDTCPEGPAQ
jgi:pimeloyl-ACP methyl ester carboxylesterase